MNLLFYKASAKEPIYGLFAGKHFSNNICGPISRQELDRLIAFLPGEEVNVEIPVKDGPEMIEFLQKFVEFVRQNSEVLQKVEDVKPRAKK